MNSVAFDDWQFAEGEALRRELTESLDRMIDYYAGIEDWAAVVRYARQWLQEDALNELGYRKLMDALVHQGKRSDALQTYAECTSVLMAELGLSPEAATVELGESIRVSTQSEPPLLRSRKRQPHSLPAALSPIIGRRDMADRLEVLLKDESSRIVTLVGLGGSGKTSLALHVGRRIEKHFKHGAVFVSLDSEGGRSMPSSNIAQALGIAHTRDDHSALIEQLADYLRDRALLLILDGAERVLPHIVALLPILEAAPHLRILLTSRIALGTRSEIAVQLHGLAYPATDVPPEEATTYAAVRLLRIAAQRQGHSSEELNAELSGMARLTRLLEGSPLGLEMAAGWRSILTWDEIADRVSNKLEFLVQLREDVAPRHRAFAAVFEGAWVMLSERGKTALRRLSVFRGTFTMQAAEVVAEVPPSILALLVNRCLIKRVGPERYEIHELLRQFASGKLTSTEREIERVRARHSKHYLQSVVVWFQALKGSEQYPTLRRMKQDLANVRLAFQYAAEMGASDLLRESSEGVFFYYDMCTQFEEAETVFTRANTAYARCEDQDDEVAGFLQIAAGWCAHHLWPDQATERLAEGLARFVNAVPMTRLHAMANVICAYASYGSYIEAHVRRVQASVQFYQANEDQWGEGLATAAWAGIESCRDEIQGEQLAYQSLRLHREIGDAWGEGLVLSSLARHSEARGDLHLALTRYEESQRLSEPIAGDIVGVIEAISGQARVLGKLGEGKRSERLAMQAVRLSQGIGNRLQMARANIELARARQMLGNTISAKVLFEEAFSLLTHRRWNHWQADCALLLLNLAMEDSDVGAADRWYREASMLEPEHPALPAIAQQLGKLRRAGNA